MVFVLFSYFDSFGKIQHIDDNIHSFQVREIQPYTQENKKKKKEDPK